MFWLFVFGEFVLGFWVGARVTWAFRVWYLSDFCGFAEFCVLLLLGSLGNFAELSLYVLGVCW